MGTLLAAMTEDKLENQRQVVMNERRQRVDNQPYGQAGETLNELLYPEPHPYRWPVIGYMEDIEAATLDDVRHFFRTYYSPSNAVLTLAGEFDPAEALALVRRHFGHLANGSAPPPPLPSGAALSGDRAAVLEDEVQLPRVYQAYRIPRFGERQWYVADLLAQVLAAGKTSRLYRDLVYERELAQSVSCYALPTELEASFHAVATCRPETDPGELETAIDTHLAAIGRGELEPAEVDRAKNRTLTSYFSGLQTLDRRADLFSMFTTFFDRPEAVAEEAQTYRDIELDELVSFANEHLRPNDRARVRVVPAP